MDKAARASASARLLLDAGDLDGAVNRAYFAMFDAAKAALIQDAGELAEGLGKTHSGLIAAFGQQLVKAGKLPIALGRQLNPAEELRLVADYRADVIRRDDAGDMVSQAGDFVLAIQSVFFHP
ncbi:MAG: HEPN domain-containing protein [Gammaproteobacteria bacterium]|nr:HEPN domain-containing protein [Gammaproteobacteria bacterium]